MEKGQQTKIGTEASGTSGAMRERAVTANSNPQPPRAPDDRGKGKATNLDFILDIPFEVTVELGRTRMIVNDLLQLGQGSVIELNKLAGEPMEILVNQQLIARGEVVVINEKFGIRLTDIISPIERVEQLRVTTGRTR